MEIKKESGIVRPWLLITLGVAIFAAAFYFGYYFFTNKNDEAIVSPVATSSTSTSVSSLVSPSASASSAPGSTATEIPAPEDPAGEPAVAGTPPTVVTKPATAAGPTFATLHGEVTSAGTSAVTNRYFRFYKGYSCTGDAKKYGVHSEEGKDPFWFNFGIANIQLTPLTEYSYKASAQSAAGDAKGDCINFKTDVPYLPTVTATPSMTVSLIWAATSDNPQCLLGSTQPNLIWNTTNAVTCSASGDWSGSKSINWGSETLNKVYTARTYNYTLTCRDVYANSKSSTVSIPCN